MSAFDVIIENGTVFDGTAASGVRKHGGVREGRVEVLSDAPPPRGPATRVVDATGQWLLIGFSDAGAHLRNMAHYNFPLRMLRVVQESIKCGAPCMPIEKAVWRLTGELGGWLNLDAGVLAPGKRADVTVVDPARLTDALDVAVEAPMPFFDGFVRMVNQNDGAVRAVLVNGREAVREGVPVPELGTTRFGQVLRVNSPPAKEEPVTSPTARTG